MERPRSRPAQIATLAVVLVSCGAPSTTVGDASVPRDPAGQCTTPQTSPMRLLTRHEYNRTVQDLLGDVTAPAREFPREPLLHDLDNDAALNRVGDNNVIAYFNAAIALSESAIENRRASLVGACTAGELQCGKDFVRSFGLRAFRRPLTVDELLIADNLFADMIAKHGFNHALKGTLQSFLQSPQFLYRTETPASEQIPDGVVSLNGYELATKLSYFIRGTTPDAPLFAAAASGSLATEAGLSAMIDGLLASQEGTAGLTRFFANWLSLDAVSQSEKNEQIYQGFTPNLPKSWQKSLELFVNEVLRTDPSVKGLLASRNVFLNLDMAMYGSASAAQPAGMEYKMQQLPAERASGLLTQPGFLAFKALHDGSSPIRRGIFVLDKLLCEPPPPPPENQLIVPPPLSATLTTRQRFDNHRTAPSCASCHRVIDPVGFTFETYDGMGLWRDSENGQPINAIGGITEATDQTVLGNQDDLPSMARKLAGSRQVHDCIAAEIYRYAIGRQLTPADECALAPLEKRFFESGGNFLTLVSDIAKSPAFRQHATPK